MEFSVMEFFNPERITYMYSVNNGQWVTMQSGINRISFNDMTPGTYKFSIKAKDYTFYSEPKISLSISLPHGMHQIGPKECTC